MKNYPTIGLAVLTLLCLFLIFNLQKRVSKLERFFDQDEPVPAEHVEFQSNAPAIGK